MLTVVSITLAWPLEHISKDNIFNHLRYFNKKSELLNCISFVFICYFDIPDYPKYLEAGPSFHTPPDGLLFLEIKGQVSWHPEVHRRLPSQYKLVPMNFTVVIFHI